MLLSVFASLRFWPLVRPSLPLLEASDRNTAPALAYWAWHSAMHILLGPLEHSYLFARHHTQSPFREKGVPAPFFAPRALRRSRRTSLLCSRSRGGRLWDPARSRSHGARALVVVAARQQLPKLQRGTRWPLRVPASAQVSHHSVKTRRQLYCPTATTMLAAPFDS